MQVGIVGKPNVGKSTFFSAATMAPAEIADYPFTTIAPNRGVAYVRTECPCKSLGVKCDPHNSPCVDGVRLVPIEMLDVAGLVPDAWQGKGLGNRFLDDLRQADALINVIDVSGGTDPEGVPGKPGTHDPVQEVEFLRNEIVQWVNEILSNGFPKMARTAKMTGAKPEDVLRDRLVGLNLNDARIKASIAAADPPPDPTKWDADVLMRIAIKVREHGKPMVVAMNKADVAPPGNLERVSAVADMAFPVMAEAELALKKAAEAGLVRYRAGDATFEIIDESKMTQGQKNALGYIAKNMEKHGGTGVQRCLERAVFGLLDLIAVFPVEDENKYTDGQGRVLPDAFLVPRGSTAKDLAYKVHTELGDKFIRAVNARTKRTVGADHVLEDGDVIRIVADR
ncbi:MAG: redox-regulated ATPase YchF [Thermoplasmatales archaeon]|nr:redox-regulated ATPase YchF [Thermoplasmatales archaeon]